MADSPLLDKHPSRSRRAQSYPHLQLAIRYLAGGLANTAFTYFIYWLLLLFTSYHVAYAVSYCIGILSSYLINVKLVFYSRHTWKRLALFPLVYLSVYAAGAAILEVAVRFLHISPMFAPMLSIVATVPLSFFLIKYLLKPSKRTSGTGSSTERNDEY